jgi:hypothetical protein
LSFFESRSLGVHNKRQYVWQGLWLWVHTKLV